MKSKVVRIILFCIIGCLLFCVFYRVFRFKYAKALNEYNTLPRDTVDVLFVGSSHAYRNINPATLYEEQGISSFTLGSASQPMWNTYYYIKEALITQSPKIVVVECYKSYLQPDYSDDAITVKATLDFHFSANYLEAVWNSIEDKSRFADFALQFPWFHTRYKELNLVTDIQPYYGKPSFYKSFLGFTHIYKPLPAKLPSDISQITQKKALSAKTREYLDKIIDLSKERNFELVFVIVPFAENAERYQPYYNSLADFLSERGFPLLNMNYLFEELELDPDMDFGKGNHLSLRGADKATSYLGRYLKERFDLPDHRNDSRYSRWEQNAAVFREIRSGKSIKEIDIDE